MPRAPRHALSWSSEQELYECSTQGRVVHRFQPGDDAAWLTWLDGITSLAFRGRSGSLNVFEEKRSRGGRYWYAYHTDRHGIRKRYLGQTDQVTLARLEATALSLAGASPPPTRAPTHTAGSGASGASARRAVTELLMLLGTKLSPPLLPNALVERPRLLAALDRSLSTPLTLLSASAGWGKTTLLAAWARQHEECVAWLSLDELDNTPTRFWVALIAALRSAASAPPDLGDMALELLLSPQPPPLSASGAALLRDFENLEHLEGRVAHPTSLVVVLDDYQVISDPAIHESLTFWLEHLPAHVHVVLASRVDPDLPLARLRVRGQLSELRIADLHFRPDEASVFLQQVMGTGGAPLADEEVAALQRRTEGWAAGLQLAALSLRQLQQDDRAAWLAAWTGSQRYLLDYVQEEILARQPDDLQRFLLHTAVLSRLSAPVCQAVVAAPEAQTCQKTLEALERANLFVVPLDEERRWYRVHDLFREALLARLSAHEPELLPQLHLRAARWYEAVGDLQEAIVHALAAPDFAYGARMMEQAAHRFWLSGEALTVQGWMAALPDAVLWQHARLALQATLSLLESLYNTTEATYAHAQAEVDNILTRLEVLLRQRQHRDNVGQPGDASAPSAHPEELWVIGRRLRLLRALIEARECLRRADKVRLVQLAEELDQRCQGEDITWQMVARRLDFWLTEAFEREGALLISRLIEAREQAEHAGDLLARLRVRAWLAHLYVHAAQWPQVEQECLAGLTLIAQSGVRTAWAGYLQSSLAEVYYAWNRLDEAACALHEELRIAEEWQQVDLLIDCQLNLAQVHLARGDLAAADGALRQAEDLVRREPFAHLPSVVAAFRVRYWLAAGDLEAARHWAEQVAFSLDPDHWDQNNFLALLMLGRVHLAQRQHRQALDLLERFRAQLDQPGNIWRTVEWLPVHVVALHQAGERRQAHTVLARVLALTQPTGSLRVYLDQGEPMRQALQAFCLPHAQQQEQPPAIAAYVARLRAAFEDAARGAGWERRVPQPAHALVSSTPDTALTRREQEVLRLLAEGASNHEIAQALVISLATVKKHVSNLLGKLGVTSRTQAIAQARARSLL